MVDPSRVRVTGPLVPYVEGFWAVLAGTGYTAWSVEAQLRLVAHLSRWLAAQGLGVADLAPEVIEEFSRAGRGERYVDRRSPRGLAPLLDYLRGLGVVSTPRSPVMPVEQLIQDYCEYLLHERGMAAGSVSLGEEVAHRFSRSGRNRSVMVGDSLARDVDGAIAAGLWAIWVNRSGSSRPEDCPGLVEIATLSDLPGALQPLPS